MNPRKTQFIIGNHRNPKKSKDFTSLQISFIYTGFVPCKIKSILIPKYTMIKGKNQTKKNINILIKNSLIQSLLF